MMMKSHSFILHNKLKIFYLILLAGGLIIFLGIYFFSYQFRKKNQAAVQPFVIENQRLRPNHFFFKKNNVKTFSFFSRDNLLELDRDQAKLGALAFVNKEVQLKQLSTVQTILPKKISNQLYLVKKHSQKGKEHFFYQQKFENYPVYGSFVNLHFNESGGLYGFQGAIVDGGELGEVILNQSQAENKALEKAKKEVGDIPLRIIQSEKNILNKKILGLEDDNKNYVVQTVLVSALDQNKEPFARKYFVNLANGEIVYEENLILYDIARYIYDGQPELLARREGDPPTGIRDVDNAYDFLGEIYNYYLNNFNRRSYDGLDSPFNLIARYRNSSFCSLPNAALDLRDKRIYLCNGMATRDIIAHEVTHGVNERLLMAFQSGAISEALSDIMAAGLDRNWTMGENSAAGIVRYMDNPPQSPRPQPDRLFSENYRCANVAGSDNDYGYIHHNMGVINKMFYLMVSGGEFNGCSITGIGWEQALQIIYRYMTVYMTSIDNFRSAYNSILQSCYDLYQENSSTCINVTNALRAVEIDQQPVGEQRGAICLGILRQAPNCINNVSSTTLPTTSISQTPFPTQTSTPAPSPSPTITPISTSIITPTPTSTSTSTVILNLRLRFQGIFQKPKNSSPIVVKVKLTNARTEFQTDYQTATFTVDDNGIWRGRVAFSNVAPGDQYTLYVKGPKHLQKRICDNDPSENYPATYNCNQGRIILREGENNLDLSKIILLIGDLPDQDGIVNSYDISLVRNNLGRSDEEALRLADVNFDDIVNTQDYSLIIAALSIRLDEQ